MFRTFTTIAVGLVALSATGCSMVYYFDFRGIIKNSENGIVIGNAKIVLMNENGRELQSTFTDSHGAFLFTVDCSSPHAASEGWRMIVSAEGYVAETIDLGPIAGPQQGNGRTQVIINSVMRPMPKWYGPPAPVKNE